MIALATLAIILLIINYMCYAGMFLDKSFTSKKDALIWLIPFYVLVYGICASVQCIWELAQDAWKDLN